MDCNFKTRKVVKSVLRALYSFIWNVLFCIFFRNACDISMKDYESIYTSEMAVSRTVFIELIITYVMVVSMEIINFKNINSSVKLFNELFELSDSENVNLELFDSCLGWQVVLTEVLSDLGMAGFFILNLFWTFNVSLKNIFNPNLYQNSALNAFVLVFPILKVTRVSQFITFSIFTILRFLKSMNENIQRLLILAENPGNISTFCDQIDDVRASYGKVLSTIKLLESSYGAVIVLLQCFGLIVGINQVKLLIDSGFFLNNSKKVFYVYSLFVLSGAMEVQQIALLIFIAVHFFPLYLVSEFGRKFEFQLFKRPLGNQNGETT